MIWVLWWLPYKYWVIVIVVCIATVSFVATREFIQFKSMKCPGLKPSTNLVHFCKIKFKAINMNRLPKLLVSWCCWYVMVVDTSAFHIPTQSRDSCRGNVQHHAALTNCGTIFNLYFAPCLNLSPLVVNYKPNVHVLLGSSSKIGGNLHGGGGWRLVVCITQVNQPIFCPGPWMVNDKGALPI